MPKNRIFIVNDYAKTTPVFTLKLPFRQPTSRKKFIPPGPLRPRLFFAPRPTTP
jgi:hypothetical protein